MRRTIGNEIFKTIVEMSCEMELASKVLRGLARKHETVKELMKRGQTFRDDEDILKEVTKLLAISPDNKKYWRFDVSPMDGENGFVLTKQIPISVSGEYRIMLSIVKHTEYEVARDRQLWNALYIHLMDCDDEVINNPYETQIVIRTQPTVFTIALIKREALSNEFNYVREAYEEMYCRFAGAHDGLNARKWLRYMPVILKKKNAELYEKIRRRYGTIANHLSL